MNYPELATGVLIYDKDGKIFLATGKKFGGLWTIPGGHVEFGERLDKCALREVSEETGFTISHPRFVSVQESIQESDRPDKHLVFINYFAEYVSGELRLEQEEFSDGRWFSLEEASELLMNSSTRTLIEKFKKQWE